MTGRRNRGGCAQLVGSLIVLGLVLLILKWALITAAILVIPFGVWWIWDHARSSRSAKAAQARELAARQRRQELESRATVDAAGGCGWCGSRILHRDSNGTVIRPVDHHRAEIEEQLGLELGRPSRRAATEPGAA
jgi:ABC-type nickel/cobalt efflux system permease component RcnA